MYIVSPKHKYLIVQAMITSESRDIYQCILHTDDLEKKYVMIKLNKADESNELIQYITLLQSKNNFNDLEEYFIIDNDFYFVFKFAKGENPISKLMLGSYSLLERMRIGEAIIRSIILQDMPCYFAYDALRKEHLKVMDDLEVNFEYELEDILECNKYTMNEINEAFEVWTRLLFKEEIKNRVSGRLMNFLKELKKHQYVNYHKLYKAYLDVCTELKMLSEIENGLAPKSFLSCLIENINIFFIKSKNILAVLLLLILIAASIIYFSYYQKKNNQRESIFESIGTVQMKNEGGL